MRDAGPEERRMSDDEYDEAVGRVEALRVLMGELEDAARAWECEPDGPVLKGMIDTVEGLIAKHEHVDVWVER